MLVKHKCCQNVHLKNKIKSRPTQTDLFQKCYVVNSFIVFRRNLKWILFYFTNGASPALKDQLVGVSTPIVTKSIGPTVEHIDTLVTEVVKYINWLHSFKQFFFFFFFFFIIGLSLVASLIYILVASLILMALF